MKHGAKLVKKLEKAGLFCAKDIKKATISYNSGQKGCWIEELFTNFALRLTDEAACRRVGKSTKA